MAVNINVPSQVKTYANLAAFPATGALKTIYIAEDTNKTYRWTGSVYVEVSASASGITIGSTAIASGVVGRVLFEGAGNVVQESSSLFWDATNNRLGIGTSTPAYALEISSASGSQTAGILVKNTGGGSSDYSSLNLLNNNNILSQIFNTSSGYTISPVIGANGFGHYTNGSGGITLWADGGVIKFITGTGANAFGSQKMTLATTGNLLINTATDAGFRLDVNGTARVQGNAQFGTGFYWDNTNARLGIGTSTPAYALEVKKSVVGDHGTNIQNTSNSTSARSFFQVSNDTNQYAEFLLNSSTYTGSTRFGITGQAAFMDANVTTILGTIGTNALIFGTNNIERVRVFGSTGNVGINTTTDAGFRLDVNGTARFSGQVNVTTNTTIGTDGTITNTYLRNAFSAVFGAVAYAPASVVLECRSTTQGFLPPRMTTTQKNAIASPATGLQVYDTTLNQMSYYNGTTWTNI